MNSFFSSGPAFDCVILEEWSRDSMIEEILLLTDEYPRSLFYRYTLEEINDVLDEVRRSQPPPILKNIRRYK